MIYDYARFKEIITRLELTPNQMYLCIMLMLKGRERKDTISAYIEKYGYFTKSDLDNIVDKGYVEDLNSPNVSQTITLEDGKTTVVKKASIVELYMVTPKFKEGIYIDDEDAAKEAWGAYPKAFNIDGVPTPALNIEYDIFVQEYGKIIQGNGILHKEIVECFTKYKKLVRDKRMGGMGLKKAIATKLWETIKVVIEMEEEEKFGKEK